MANQHIIGNFSAIKGQCDNHHVAPHNGTLMQATFAV